MKKRHVVTFMSLLAAVSVGLTGCSSNSATSETSEKGITIRYSNFISNGGNEENLAKIVEAFEADNPGVTVEVTTLPYADYFTALQTELAGGTSADVFDIEQANYGGYQKSNVLAPLEGVDTTKYRDSVIESYSTDGVPYALPTSFSDVVLYYNQDLFDAAGLDYPTSDWTWADEKEAALALTNSGEGIWGDYQPISYHEFYKTIAQSGGNFLSADGSKVAFNSPEGKQAAEWLVSKSATTMPTAEQGAGTPDFDSKLFAEGKLAMWHSGIWNFGIMDDSKVNWNVVVEPGNTQQANAVFSNAVAVSATSPNLEMAQKFAEYLTSSEIMTEVRLENNWELPPLADESKLSSYLDAGDPQNRQAVFDALENIAPAPSIGTNQAQMEDVVTEELTEAAAGRKTVEEALSSMETQVNQLL